MPSKKILILFFLSLWNSSWGQSLLEINKETSTNYIGKSIYVYRDKSQKIPFSTISSPSFASNFQTSNQDVLSFGITKDIIWLKIQVKNLSNAPLLLEIRNPSIDSMLFFYPQKQSSYQIKALGAMLPIEKNALYSPFYLFELDSGPQIQTYFLRIKNSSSSVIPVQIGSYVQIIQQLNLDNIWMALYFGILLAMLFYNIFLGIAIREIAYFYYIIYVFGFGLNMFYLKGFQNLLSEPYRQIIYFATPVCLCLSMIAMLSFNLRFLRVKEFSPYLAKYLQFLAWLFPIYIVFRFTAFSSIGIFIFQSLVFLVSFSSLITGFYVYLKGYQAAKYYLLAWTFFWVFLIIYLLIINNLLPFYSFTPYLLPLGSAGEVILLSFALADRINILRKEKLFAQSENLKLVTEHNQSLEEKVQARTAEIVDKNNEIEAQNEELRQQKEEVEAINNHLEEIVVQRTQDLQKTIDNLLRQNQDLEQFSFIISHNLRSPVARLLGLVNIFDVEHPDNPANLNYLNFIKQTAQNLDALIYDLTKIITIRNNLIAGKEHIAWINLIDNCLHTLTIEIKEVEANISFDIVGKDTIYSIRAYLDSILHNLLSNAIKYRSPNRSLEIHIEIKELNNEFCLSVKDNGLGIDLSKHTEYQIFGLYQRLHTNREGKGLGLYLVKTQVEALGGRIEVESQVEVGSTFRVYLLQSPDS